MLRNSLNGDRRNGVVTERRRDIRPTDENALKTTPTSFQGPVDVRQQCADGPGLFHGSKIQRTRFRALAHFGRRAGVVLTSRRRRAGVVLASFRMRVGDVSGDGWAQVGRTTVCHATCLARDSV